MTSDLGGLEGFATSFTLGTSTVRAGAHFGFFIFCGKSCLLKFEILPFKRKIPLLLYFFLH